MTNPGRTIGSGLRNVVHNVNAKRLDEILDFDISLVRILGSQNDDLALASIETNSLLLFSE